MIYDTPETESDRLFREAACPLRYPAWLWVGGVGLNGAGDRLLSAFVPWSKGKGNG